ncbi:MAG TPA: glycosyltransferase family 39 protein [Candidatus Omnitrophota bacterium]|nr:glycosyltransferase family 39 protein [Candidatus Omnitrophota bacterium]
MKHWKYNILLLALGYVLLMMGNGLIPLTHPDEVFYAQTAQEMLSRESWLIPILFEHPQFEKPIFFYWLLVGAARFFGLTAFTARFWPAFFGMMGLLITYWVAWLLFRNKRVSFLAGVIQGTSFIYIALSRAVLTDMVFSMWVVLALGAFYGAYRCQDKRDLGHLLFWVCVGLAVLTKGLLGLCFPVGTVLLFLSFQKDWGYLRSWSVLRGGIVFLLIAAPWHGYIFSQYGDGFINEYFLNVHIRRLFVAEHAKCNTWYFYALTLGAGFLPWTFLCAPPLARIPSLYKNKLASQEPFVFLLSWFLGIFIFVQPASSKLASYIFPAFPVITILSALCLDDFLRSYQDVSRRGVRFVQFSVSLFGSFLLLSSLGVVMARNYFKSFAPQAWPVVIMALAFGGFGVLLVFFVWRKKFYAVTGLFTLFPMILILSFLLFRSMAVPWVSCQDIATVLRTLDQSGTTLLVSKFYVRGVRYFTGRDIATVNVWGEDFYSPHPIPFLNTDRKVADFLKAQPFTFAVVKKGDLEDLVRICALNGFALRNMGGVGGKYILRIQP